MNKLLRLFVIFTIFALLLTNVACNSSKSDEEPSFIQEGSESTEESGEGETKAVNSTELTKISLYLKNYQSATPMNLNQINEMKEELDKRTGTELNTIVELNWVEMNEYDDKVKALIQSNDAIDAIDASNFISLLANDLTKDITNEFKQFAPSYYKLLDETMPERIKSATHDEKVLYIPNMDISTSRYCALVRKDLLEKYNIASIKDISEYEAFLKKILESEPNVLPGYINAFSFMDFYALSQGYLSLDSIYAQIKNDSFEMYTIDKLSEFDNAYNALKEWSDKGLISVKNEDIMKLLGGEGASTIVNINMLEQLEGYLSNIPNVQFEIFPLCMDKIQVRPNSSSGGIAIAKNSENAKNVIQFYEWVQSSQENYDLFMNGVKDKHYTLDNGAFKVNGTKYQNAVSGWFGSQNFKNYKMHRSSIFSQERYVSLLEMLNFENTQTFEVLAKQSLSPEMLGSEDSADIIKLNEEMEKIKDLGQEINGSYMKFMQEISLGDFSKSANEYKEMLKHDRLDEFISFLKEVYLKYYKIV